MKYRLKKDLPWAKAGTIYVGNDNCRDTQYYPEGKNILTEDVVTANYIKDPEWFEPVEERWKPENGEQYYFVTEELSTTSNAHPARYGTNTDDCRNRKYLHTFMMAIGFQFQKKEQAEEGIKRIKQTLMGYHKEINNDQS